MIWPCGAPLKPLASTSLTKMGRGRRSPAQAASGKQKKLRSSASGSAAGVNGRVLKPERCAPGEPFGGCGEDIINPDHGAIAELEAHRDKRHGKPDRPEGIGVREPYIEGKNQPNTNDRDKDPDS